MLTFSSKKINILFGPFRSLPLHTADSSPCLCRAVTHWIPLGSDAGDLQTSKSRTSLQFPLAAPLASTFSPFPVSNPLIPPAFFPFKIPKREQGTESPFLGLVLKSSRPVAKEKPQWQHWAMVPLEGLQHPRQVLLYAGSLPSGDGVAQA